MRRIHRHAYSLRFLAGLLTLWLASLPLQAQISDSQSTTRSGTRHLASLERSIRIFDFEEAEDRLVVFPDNFYRRSPRDGAWAQGFPPFGSMILSKDAAVSGNWSFKFSLNGGSLSARTANNVIPILPLADYAVVAKVRTAGLTNSRARLVAWLNDHHGQPIPESRVESPLLQTRDIWEMVSVEIYGEYENAADLIIELQVLQPRQFMTRNADPDLPRFEDFSGDVWFDDIKVLHLPRVELNSIQEGNITTLPEKPMLSILVRDLASEPLITQLYVYDLDGNRVFSDQYGPARGQQRQVVSLPIDRCGWYRAVLIVRTEDKLIDRRWLDFVVVPEVHRPRVTSGNRFSLVIPEMPTHQLPSTPQLVREMLIGHVVFPIWTQSLSKTGKAQRYEILRRTIAKLLQTDLELTFSLNRLPDELAHDLGLDPDQVLEMFGENPEIWRPFFEGLLVNFGLEVSRWQAGTTGSTELVKEDNLSSLIQAAEEALGKFIASPEISIPWSAEYAFPNDSRLKSFHTTIPYNIQAESLGDYVTALGGDSTDIMATFEPLLDENFSARQQATDLMLRTLEAWRLGIRKMGIMAPWTWNRQHTDQLMIKPAYSIWRTLTDRLNGRVFAGELFTKDGLHCWILKGQSRKDAALAIWTDRYRAHDPEKVQIYLGSRNIQLIDGFGNVTDLSLESGMHTITPQEMPIFIENINLELAQFRSAFAIKSDFIPAMNRVHEHKITLNNPWDFSISGKLTLTDTDDLEISPRTFTYSIRPGATATLPIHIKVGRSVLAGKKTIKARATINADQEYTLEMQTNATVGLPNVEFSASWGQALNVQTGQNDLVITQVITNTGDSVLNLDVFVMAPNYSLRRRRLPPLSPGESVVKLFNLGHSNSIVSAQQIRVGVEERNGTMRLNRMLTIPIPDEGSTQFGLVPK